MTRRPLAALPGPAFLLLRRGMVASLLLAVAALAVVALVSEPTLHRVDGPLSKAIRGDGDLRHLFGLLTEGGSQQIGVLIAVPVVFASARHCRAFALVYPLALAAGVVVDVALKVMVDRPRPPLPLTGTSLGSFPSGHAIHAVIAFGLLPPLLYLLSGRRWAWRAAIVVAVVGAAAVVVSRVYLGAHWPTDVLASVLLGSLILLAAELLLGSGAAARACRGCRLHATAPV